MVTGKAKKAALPASGYKESKRTGRASESQASELVIARHAFAARKPTEMSFAKGDIIQVVATVHPPRGEVYEGDASSREALRPPVGS